jgi:hypothetical protein
MTSEAAGGGFVEIGSGKYPRIQILTIRETLEEGKWISYPSESARDDLPYLHLHIRRLVGSVRRRRSRLRSTTSHSARR